MRKFLAVLFSLFLCSASIVAQTTQHPSGLSFKRLLVDYLTANGETFSGFNRYNAGMEVSYLKNLGPKLNLAVPLKVAVVKQDSSLTNRTTIGLGAQLQYNLLNNVSQFNPYVLGGLAFVSERKVQSDIQIPLGAGVNIRLNDRAFLNLQSAYRISTGENRNNFHHGLGFLYLFGNGDNSSMPLGNKEDRDNDGILDTDDKCPEVAGLIAFGGCPDTDKDGIEDSEDLCPEVPGLQALKGCPDTDGDGVSDAEDNCPNIPGSASNNGCPSLTDSDGDGVVDAEDKCPNIKGNASASGCPDRDADGVTDAQDECPDVRGFKSTNGCPDDDGDGIANKRDRCPNSFGTAANFGCPGIEASDRDVLSLAMRAVQFDHNRNTIKSESFTVLNQIADIMARYPDYNLTISGHTDNTGGTSLNQKLSEQRARACFDYLTSRGVATSRMDYAGFGESRPIADNETQSGRATNRRVEFEMYPRRR